jgi:spore coat polysaccharide biosynthesis protein SpsF
MRTAIIIQARMTSTRLPGKILKEVLGRPLLTYQIERLRHVEHDVDIIVATTTNRTDNPVADLCQNLSIPCYRGSEDDVLARYYETANAYGSETIVRLTSDCPLIDPQVVDSTIGFFVSNLENYDYVSNTLQRSFPRGMDTEVFSMNALERAYQNAAEEFEREHVTPYIYLHPDRFRVGGLINPVDLSKYRWTVDTQEDFRLIELMLTHLYPVNPVFSMDDCLSLLEVHPEWFRINETVKQKPLMPGSPTNNG